MSKIGLTITLNKYNKYFKSINKLFLCDTLDETKNTLINYLIEQFKSLLIDFPSELEDLRYMWFDQQNVEAEIFKYKIFINNRWDEPWEPQEIYSEVLEIMFNKECELHANEIEEPYESDTEMKAEEDNSLDTKELFSRLNKDSCEDITLFEKKFLEIINQAKNTCKA